MKQKHFFFTLPFFFVISCITGQVIDGSAPNESNFLERALAEIKSIVEEFSRFSTNSSALFGDGQLLSELASHH
jgi:cytochrome b subunit of formate dehydrogenase